MGFIGTTAAVGLGGALIPFFGFLLRVLGLLILFGFVLAYCSDDDGHRARNPSYATCRQLVVMDPPTWDHCSGHYRLTPEEMNAR